MPVVRLNRAARFSPLAACCEEEPRRPLVRGGEQCKVLHGDPLFETLNAKNSLKNPIGTYGEQKTAIGSSE
jgi:hypothetical protein